MKKLAIVVAMVLAFVGFGHAFALEWEDPSLCVNGKWLLIIAGNASAIQVTVPSDAHVGNQAAGGCTTPAPATVLPASSVSTHGNGEKMTVTIDGRGASPTVLVSYGTVQKSKTNNGGTLKFKFELDDAGGDD